MLEINNLTVEVGGRRVLKGVDLHVEAGHTNVLFGPNGAGKSVLLMTLMGFSGYKVIEGEIIFKGEDITNLSVSQRAQMGMGIMSQRPPNLNGVKLHDLLDVIAEDLKETEELAESVGMMNFFERDINVGFSGGEIKRSELLQLSAQNPDFLLLDEPESGVDLASIELLGTTINKLLKKDCKCPGERCKHGKSALVITHTGQVLDYLETDRAYILCNGTVMCSGNPREMLTEIKEQGYEECIKCKLMEI
ncbi:ABC transporter ATP-binding protein [Methanolobus halotolerans]|uniref:ABC transporter ATP-binding protein n=1 Tax=Methanolobus halotolerans TaxID=2052935 RepID=A0A4E0QXL3_9EURY|nr:ABC transporter ATP-binding protein [Methanolobus halotolerans]TGC07923.1 ABC transporter ATP-binding protein [Methanolobus halotolerans]